MAEVYRADHVGSLLRPPAVADARQGHREGRVSAEQLRDTEDQAILAALERQRQIGLDIFSDGEFRRTGFQNDFSESVDGYVIDAARPAVVRIWQGPGGEPREQGTAQVVAGKLRQRRRLTQEQIAFLKEHSPGPFKMTLPSPNQFPTINYQEGITDEFYPTRSDLLRDITGIIQSESRPLSPTG
jgi:5-methyltetrahydropteroyltriglutamate--homocysteine methyltransferase